MAESERRPHAILDVQSRNAKALKIETLLRLSERRQPLRMLEIGTGSGGIAHYFGKHPTIACHVTAVDVLDQRVVSDGFDFKQVDSVRLPFDDASFDVVISNHVIEHVGQREAQEEHLREFARVLRQDGIGYLAVPNRWALTEPHFGLPFLSWLPRGWRSPYVRIAGRGEQYDCEPLEPSVLDDLIAKGSLQARALEAEAVRIMLSHEKASGLAIKIANLLPRRVLTLLGPLMPTLIRKVWHP